MDLYGDLFWGRRLHARGAVGSHGVARVEARAMCGIQLHASRVSLHFFLTGFTVNSVGMLKGVGDNRVFYPEFTSLSGLYDAMPGTARGEDAVVT